MANTNVKMVELAERAVAEEWTFEEIVNNMFDIGCDAIYDDEEGLEFSDEDDNRVAFYYDEEEERALIIFNDNFGDFRERVHNLFT